MELEQSLDPIDAKWRAVHGSETASLLKLSLIRDWQQVLHRIRSQALTFDDQSLIQTLNSQGERLSMLLDSDLSPLRSLRQALDPDVDLNTLPRSPVTHPSSACISEEKFKRFDRQIEGRIFKQGLANRWKAWTLDSWISLPLAEKFHLSLKELLWPQGILLFVENSSASAQKASIPAWQGCWYVMLEDGFQGQDFVIESLPGFINSIDPPLWTCICTKIVG